MCKFSEGVLLPFVVQMAYDAINNPVNTGRVLEATHWAGTTPYLAKGSFDSVGGSDLLPVFPGTGKKIEEFIEVLLQATDGAGNGQTPTS